MAKGNILVVDDEEDILELVRYNLMREGYGVLCAATGEEAVRIAGEAVPDLIVLDLMLPGVDGLEVTRMIKGAPKTASIPIVMLTAKGEEADIVTGLEMGADDYVSKPFSPRVLSARIKAVLRRSHEKAAQEDPDGEIRIGDLRIRPGMHLVTVRDENVTLTFRIRAPASLVQAPRMGLYTDPDCGQYPRNQLCRNGPERGCSGGGAAEKTGGVRKIYRDGQRDRLQVQGAGRIE